MCMYRYIYIYIYNNDQYLLTNGNMKVRTCQLVWKN